jgi:nucleoside-diphosphate-sugar epimerase
MKYFVTGATGFVGGRVAQQLRGAGHQVITLVRDPARATHLAAAGMQLAQGDVTDKESMRAPMLGCDGVFHVAGWYKIGVKDKSPGAAVNIKGTRNVMELMKELGIPKGVYTSTLAVNSDTHGELKDENYHFNGTHLSEYDRTKAAAHDVAMEFIRDGLPLVIVQPGMIYGPGDLGPSHDLFVQFLTRTLPIMPQQTALCWAHVDDVARGHIQAMEKGKTGENYFLAGPVHTIIEALTLAEQISGVRAPALQAPPQMMKMMSQLMSRIEQGMPVPDTYSSEYLRVSAGTTYIGSNAKAKRELGWQPRPLADGLVETLQSEMKTLKAKKQSKAK